MDRKVLEFVTYCIGKLSAHLKLSQQEVYKRLHSSGILYGYIVPSYDVLHTFSSHYLIEDLTDYMREKGVLSETANLIEEGVSDLHCRSDKYLAGEVWREYQENHKKIL